MIFSIYGRVFFLTVEQDAQIQPKSFINKNINGTVPVYLYINFVKASILSEILQNPQLYLCNWTS